jgi:hypothetical protein
MTTVGADLRASFIACLRQLAASRWLWCLAATMFVVARDFAPAQLLTSLGDTDDATRLVQVRAWLASGHWYDLLLPRFGGATPLLSHWSRLIDLPIGLLLILFGTFLAASTAELAMRVVWPTLLLLLFLRLLLHEAEVRGGAITGAIALAFAATAVTGLYQFRVGRIDHHNVMIIGTVVGFLMLARSLTVPQVAYVAGAFLGMALAVGYEPILLTAPVLGGMALFAAVRPAYLTAARNAAIGFVTTLAAGLIVTAPPRLWHLSPCDALGANIVLLAAIGAVGLAVMAAQGRDWPLPLRLAALAACGAVGGAAFFTMNPACLRGPFGSMSQDAIDLWLVNVSEGKSVFDVLSGQPLAVFLALIGTGLVTAWIRYRSDRSMDGLAILSMLLLAVTASLISMKFVAYTSFLAAFAIALFVSDLPGFGSLSQLSARLLGTLVLNQGTLAMAAGLVVLAGGTSPAARDGPALHAINQCKATQAIQSLGQLPKGLIVADVDFGAYIVALTPHDVLSAPYHRIDRAIVESYKIFRSEPDIAEQKLRVLAADYVVHCIPVPQPGVPISPEKGVPRNSMAGRLSHGETVPFLEELKGVTTEPSLRVWRLTRRGG